MTSKIMKFLQNFSGNERKWHNLCIICESSTSRKFLSLKYIRSFYNAETLWKSYPKFIPFSSKPKHDRDKSSNFTLGRPVLSFRRSYMISASSS